MTLDVKELRRLAEAATPGPWRWRFSSVEQISDGGQGYPLDNYPDCVDVQGSQCEECGNRIGPSDDNGKFIAAASPSTVLALLDQLAAVTAARDEACEIALQWAAHLRDLHGDPQDRTRIAELRKVGR